MTWFTKTAVAIMAAMLAGCSHMSALNDDRSRDSESLAQEALRRPAPEYYRIPERAPRAPEHTVIVHQEHDDLWDRVRAGYAIQHPAHPSIEAEIAWYAQNQDYLNRAFERGRPYLHHIVEQLERRGMPLELSLLPVVESAFQPTAYSPSKAAGIWQFIPATGRRFGLTQNRSYDGRRDVVAATGAALDYLSELQQRFDGDWLLAVAAYNCGERNVERAVAANRAAGRPVDFWSLSLPNETRAYVPKLLAVSAVVADPARLDLTLAPIPNAPHFAVADPGHEVQLADVARALDMPLDELRHLNPGYRRDSTGGGSRALVVPVAKLPLLLAATETLPAARPVSLAELNADDDEGGSASTRKHRIRNGDTLGAIAERYKVSVAELKRVNRLKGHQIRAGRDLLVPQKGKAGKAAQIAQTTKVEGRKLQAVANASNASSRSAKAGDKGRLASVSTTEDTAVPKARPAGSRRSQASNIHTVARGDTLWLVSKRYQISIEDISALNGLPVNATLALGQQLVVANNAAATAATAQAGTGGKDLARTQVVPAKARTTQYAVRKGDSLWTIARRFDITVDTLCGLNGLSRHSQLQPGQTLVVKPAALHVGT